MDADTWRAEPKTVFQGAGEAAYRWIMSAEVDEFGLGVVSLGALYADASVCCVETVRPSYEGWGTDTELDGRFGAVSLLDSAAFSEEDFRSDAQNGSHAYVPRVNEYWSREELVVDGAKALGESALVSGVKLGHYDVEGVSVCLASTRLGAAQIVAVELVSSLYDALLRAARVPASSSGGWEEFFGVRERLRKRP